MDAQFCLAFAYERPGFMVFSFYADYLMPALPSSVTSEHQQDLQIPIGFNPHRVNEGGLQDSVAASYSSTSSILLQQKIPS